jgi:hypothetical protein
VHQTKHWLGALAVCSACTAPPEIQEFSASVDRSRPEYAFVHLPEASAFVGPNPGCPSMRVFTDVEDLCTHGIIPRAAVGTCKRMHLEIAALGGHAELFVRQYTRSDERDMFYLALRGSNGYVLLAYVGKYYSQLNDPPDFVRFFGDETSLELSTRQLWYEYDDDYDLQEVMRNETLRCDLDENGGIRCNDECPDLALVEERPRLDCSALAEVDWSSLPRGQPIEELEFWRTVGYHEDNQFYAAKEILGREIDLGDWLLTVIELERGQFALLHGEIALLASRRPIRVGSAPGGLYVSSWQNGALAVHRLHLSTHELEPVIPGPCGN